MVFYSFIFLTRKERTKKMKTHYLHYIKHDEKFEGRIASIEQYNKLKNGEIDWKPHVKNNLEQVNIPYKLFNYFMEVDKETDMEVKIKVKAHCVGRGGKFEGLIKSVEQYNRLKNGELNWKPHIKNNLESVTIPYELFAHFMEADKEMDKVIARKLEAKMNSKYEKLFVVLNDEDMQKLKDRRPVYVDGDECDKPLVIFTKDGFKDFDDFWDEHN